MRLLKTHPILGLANSFVIDSPTPANISYMWNFGSLLGVCLIIQILTGVFLAMHYTPSVDLAFVSVEHIMRDVNYGWLIRYLHANTASFFFIFVYLHIGRGLYYGSYKSPRVLLWSIGVIILVLMMAIAFLGYIHSLTCDITYFFNITTAMAVVIVPSNKLKEILTKYEIIPEYILETTKDDNNKIKFSIKSLLNSFAGVYICINKVNGKIYVGSASQGRMYRRFRGHIYLAKGGSTIVNSAINKYGINNFAFVVVKIIPTNNNTIMFKEALLSLEQYYINLLLPDYNIAKIAGSVLGHKWSEESRNTIRINLNRDHIERLRKINTGKVISNETKNILRKKALERAPFSIETRIKMSINNRKSVPFTAYDTEINSIYKEFNSIADAALYFFNDSNKRYPIKRALSTQGLLLGKYKLSKK